MSATLKTGYEAYSQVQLHGLFSSETWRGLCFADRINACQEVENRYAAANSVEPCTVAYQQMDGAAYGWQKGDTICLNSSLVKDGVFITTYMDENGASHQVRTEAMAPGWNVLDTVYHEGTHGIQEQTGVTPETYISPHMDGDLYRIQEIEKEAYAVGQAKTLEALSAVETATGQLDPERDAYFASVQADSFQAALGDAAVHYNDPNIEQVLNRVIADRDGHVVQASLSESYTAVSALCDAYYGPVETAQESSESSQAVDDGLLSGALDTPGQTPVEVLDDGLSYADPGSAPESGISDGLGRDTGAEQGGTAYSGGEGLDSGLF